MTKLIFARHAQGDVRHIADVVSGLACECTCLDCGQPLVARKGPIREHHFGHNSGQQHDWAWETHLHAYAKQLIAEGGGLVVPLEAGICRLMGLSTHGGTWRFKAQASGVQRELRRGEVRPDLVFSVDGQAFEVALEIYVTHAADQAKRREFERLCLPALEIDLSSVPRHGFDAERVRRAVLDLAGGKRWLWPPAPAPRGLAVDSWAADSEPDDRPEPAQPVPAEPVAPLPAAAQYAFPVPSWSTTVRVTLQPLQAALEVTVHGLARGSIASTSEEFAAPRIEQLVAQAIRGVAPRATPARPGVWLIAQADAGRVAQALELLSRQHAVMDTEQRTAQAGSLRADVGGAPAPGPGADNPYARRKG